MNDYNCGHQSVQTFWQGVNWENLSPTSSPLTSFNGSVQDYFTRIPWSGMAIAQPLPQTLFPEDISKSDTLEDFLHDLKSLY